MSFENDVRTGSSPGEEHDVSICRNVVGAGLLAFLGAVVLAAITAGLAHAESITAPGQPTTSRPFVLDSSAASKPIGYCPDLKRVITLALTKDRFGTIVGKPRNGDFLSTTLPLSGWKDCSLYGSRTYTCDSHELTSVEEAASAQTVMVDEIKSCLGEDWAEDNGRSSSTYIVLRTSHVPVSMTVSTNANDTNDYVVRLTLFLRTGR